MTGVITLRHVVRHPFLIMREFGVAVFGRCILHALLRTRATFLEIAWDSQVLPRRNGR